MLLIVGATGQRRSCYTTEEHVLDVKKMNPLSRAQLNFLKLADDISTVSGAGQWTKCSAACMVYLFHNGNPKNFVDSSGESVLLDAIERKEPLVLGGLTITPQALIEAGADVNVPNFKGTTPLMGAAKNGDTDLVRDLLAHGALQDAKDKKGQTAFDQAKVPEIRNLLSSSPRHRATSGTGS
jgi:ankyrin repeat protein